MTVLCNSSFGWPAASASRIGLFKPVNVDARSCDSKRTSLLGLVSIVEENLQLLWVKVGQYLDSQAKLAALFTTPIQTRNVLQRSIVTRKIRQLSQNNNTQRMPRQVDLHCSLIPLLPD
jgi:hypothetical protein